MSLHLSCTFESVLHFTFAESFLMYIFKNILGNVSLGVRWIHYFMFYLLWQMRPFPHLLLRQISIRCDSGRPIVSVYLTSQTNLHFWISLAGILLYILGYQTLWKQWAEILTLFLLPEMIKLILFCKKVTYMIPWVQINRFPRFGDLVRHVYYLPGSAVSQ